MHYTEVFKVNTEKVGKRLIPGPTSTTQHCLRMSWINKLDVTMQGYIRLNILKQPLFITIRVHKNIASFLEFV